MFGIGKLFSKLTGGLLDQIGLGFLKPFVAVAFDYFTGDYASLIGDLKGVVGQFVDLSFLDNLDKLQPLGDFAMGGFSFDKLLSGEGLNFLQDTSELLGLDKVTDMLNLVGEFNDSVNIINQGRQTAQYSFLG